MRKYINSVRIVIAVNLLFILIIGCNKEVIQDDMTQSIEIDKIGMTKTNHLWFLAENTSPNTRLFIDDAYCKSNSNIVRNEVTCALKNCIKKSGQYTLQLIDVAHRNRSEKKLMYIDLEKHDISEVGN